MLLIGYLQVMQLDLWLQQPFQWETGQVGCSDLTHSSAFHTGRPQQGAMEQTANRLCRQKPAGDSLPLEVPFCLRNMNRQLNRRISELLPQLVRNPAEKELWGKRRPGKDPSSAYQSWMRFVTHLQVLISLLQGKRGRG